MNKTSLMILITVLIITSSNAEVINDNVIVIPSSAILEDQSIINEFLTSERGLTYRQDLMKIFAEEHSYLPIEVIN